MGWRGGVGGLGGVRLGQAGATCVGCVCVWWGGLGLGNVVCLSNTRVKVVVFFFKKKERSLF